MPDGTDWIMRPVMRGLCKYGELVDGSLGLMDVGRMNDAIAVMDENTRRLSRPSG